MCRRARKRLDTKLRERAAVAGLTLIEVMIIIALMAALGAGATLGIGALTRAELRSSSLKVASASRFAFSRSISTGNTVRVVIDLDEAAIGLEESEAKIALSAMDERIRGEELATDLGSVDPWSVAKERMATSLSPAKERSSFSVITDQSGDEIEFYRSQPLGSGIRVLEVRSPIYPEPIVEGRAALYFFPGGRTSRATVKLTDASDAVYTVEIHPLTGRSKIHPFAYDPVEIEESDEVKAR